MVIDFDTLITASIAEAKTKVPPPSKTNTYSKEQLATIDALEACAADLLTGFKMMKVRSGSSFDFEKYILGSTDTDFSKPLIEGWVLEEIILQSNVYSLHEGLRGFAAVRFTSDEMTLYLNRSHQNLTSTIESLRTETPLARELATATILRKLAVMAMEDKKLT